MTDPRGQWTHASEASADVLCMGRFGAQRGLPDTGPTKECSKGDRVHAALAGEIQTMELALEDREMFDQCRALEKKLALQYFAEQTGVKVFRHERKWVRFTSPDTGTIVEHSGEYDVLYRAGTKALLMDYKTGRGDVEESPRNLQLRDLAVLVHGNALVIEEIATAVIQPLVSDNPAICVYDKAALGRAQIEMFTRINNSHKADAPRTAGEIQCGFCRAKKLCPTYQKWAAQLAPPALLGILEVPMSAWTPEQRSGAAAAIKPCKDFLEELQGWLKTGIEADPNFCPGFGLKPGNKIETITDPQICFDRAAKLGMKLEEFMGCVSVGKTKLKELVNATTGAKGKALEEAMHVITDGIVSVKQNAPSLVRVKEDK